MSSINLEEILKSKLENYSDGTGFYGFASFVNQDQINLVLEAMRDACNQTVDEAVKRCASKVTHTAGQWYSDYSCMKWNVEKVAEQLKKELE